MSYNLYLDESKVKYNGEWGYCVAGVIIEDSQLYRVRKDLGHIKTSIWKEQIGYGAAKRIVLHEVEVRSHRPNVLIKRPEYSSFLRAENVRIVVNGIGNIISNHELPVIGALENQTQVERSYLTKRSSYSSYYLALKQIIENFCHFLKQHRATGTIIFESRKSGNSNIQDKRVRKMFMKIMAHGTLRYSSMDLQEVVSGIQFIQKQENDAGLQIADFVPHPFLLHYFRIEQTKPSIYQNLRKARYTGGIGERSGAAKFGMCIFE